MKRFISAIFATLLISSVTFASSLPDINTHWAKESIERLIEDNCINGYEDGTFKPDNNITIAEFIKILVQYTDYKKILIGERWPDWYINTALHYGFIQENEFDDYNRYITRYETATILDRFIGEESIKTNSQSFSDTNDKTVIKLANMGVIKGYGDNTFRGENNITRAEATVIICRAMKERREYISKKTYNLENAERLTNIGKEPTYESDFKNRYEIKNNKIYFYDAGRYAKLSDFTIDNKNIDNKKIIKLIKSLVQEDAYVAVNYIPDKELYDQIVVEYGKREGYVYNHSYTFSFIFYPDKQFELRRNSQNENLNENCFMKISVAKMWKDAIDMKNGIYAHELNNKKLLNALNAIFEEDVAKSIYEYIQEWIPKLYENGEGNKFIEIKHFGKYEVTLYTRGNSRVEIYISK